MLYVLRTGQYRLNQAHAPVDNADNPATLRSEMLAPGSGSATGLQTKTSSPMGGNSSGAPHRNFSDSAIAQATWPSGQQEKAGDEAEGHVDQKPK
jgi:hypothetical protein